MAGNQQMLLVNPGRTLVFKGPFDKSPRVAWNIYNPTTRRVAFKVQTTSPPNFFVQPRAGVIEGTGRAVIYIQLRPCTKEFLQTFYPKFKLVDFLIPDEVTNFDVDALWETMKVADCMKTTALVRFDLSTSGSQIRIPDLSNSGTINDVSSGPLASTGGPSTSTNNNVIQRAREGHSVLVTTGAGSGFVAEPQSNGNIQGQSVSTVGTQPDPNVGSQPVGTQSDPTTTQTAEAAIQGDIMDNGNTVDDPRDGRYWWNLQGEFNCCMFWGFIFSVYGSAFLMLYLYRLWCKQ